MIIMAQVNAGEHFEVVPFPSLLLHHNPFLKFNILILLHFLILNFVISRGILILDVHG